MAEQDPGPIVQRIMLGGELRALREAAKISSDDAAAALGWYRAKVSKVETGTVRLTTAELSALLKLQIQRSKGKKSWDQQLSVRVSPPRDGCDEVLQVVQPFEVGDDT